MPLSKSEGAWRVQRRMLIIAGIWPMKDPSIFYKIRGLISFIMILSLAISLFLSVLFVTDLTLLVQGWGMFISIFNVALKYAIFFFNIPKLVTLLKFVKSSYFKYYDQDLDVYVQQAIRTATIMVKVFFSSALLTVLSFSLAPIVSPKPRQVPLPFAADMTDQPLLLYLFVYFFNAFTLSTAAWTSVAFDNVATSMMVLSAAYFKILEITIMRVMNPKNFFKEVNQQENLKNLYGKFDKIINQRLSMCVEYHLAVIRFAESVESIFTYIVLLQFLASAVAMTLAGFSFATAPVGSSDFLLALSLPITLMIQISLYCSFGNEVTLESAKICDACYMTEWITCGPLVRKTLFLIMERSKRPLILTAGKFVNLSLSSLLGVFRSAISYAAVLRQLTNK